VHQHQNTNLKYVYGIQLHISDLTAVHNYANTVYMVISLTCTFSHCHSEGWPRSIFPKSKQYLWISKYCIYSSLKGDGIAPHINNRTTWMWADKFKIWLLYPHNSWHRHGKSFALAQACSLVVLSFVTAYHTNRFKNKGQDYLAIH